MPESHQVCSGDDWGDPTIEKLSLLGPFSADLIIYVRAWSLLKTASTQANHTLPPQFISPSLLGSGTSKYHVRDCV
eukprot:2568277-Amphidinium_carterae.1